ncbi:MAG TPA: long-chain-fatty-acid--CoA ligase [Pseudonocardia sp.]|jgi:acyl-CoA synthetase (AMP-forming)/AMP-acid ligase II
MLIQEYLSFWAARAPDRVCVDDGRSVWSYAEAEAQANRFARLLTRLEVGDGDRVAFLAKNCAEWVALYAGAFKIGAVPVPLNYRHQPQEWVHPLADSGAVALITQPDYRSGIESILTELPQLRIRLLLDGHHHRWTPFADTMASCSADHLDHRVDPDHVLYQMYTSGTTGRPKGALLTHRSADANLTQLRTALTLPQEHGNLLAAPMFHAGGAMNMFTAWVAGMTSHMIIDFDPDDCARRLDDERVTMASLVPAMIQAMLVHSNTIHERRFEALQCIQYGASAINEETLREVMKIFDCDFYQVYGQTESTAVLTALSPAVHREALAGRPELLSSCGAALPGTELRIVDEHGADLPNGQIGEILARGPQLMAGYWNLPAETAATLRDGWLHTGDAGYLDGSGLLYICDRVKDMIVSGGENVFPREIEDVLHRLPGVAEAAVIGIPDQRWGETVHAVIVPLPEAQVTKELAISWCRDRLAGYKCPRSVDLVTELPRNASGKVLKRELRAPFWVGHRRGIG